MKNIQGFLAREGNKKLHGKSYKKNRANKIFRSENSFAGTLICKTSRHLIRLGWMFDPNLALLLWMCKPLLCIQIKS